MPITQAQASTLTDVSCRRGPNRHHSSNGSTQTQWCDQEIGEITVPVDTLDRVIPADMTIDFLKIDVEGAELQVLRGASAVIRRSRPVVMFECGSERAAAYGVQPEDMYDLLSDELRLEVSLMRRWLDGREGLSRREFCHLLYAKVEFCFLAYARA